MLLLWEINIFKLKSVEVNFLFWISYQATKALVFREDRDSQPVGVVGSQLFRNHSPVSRYSRDVSIRSWGQVFRRTQLLFRCLNISLGFQELRALGRVRASSCRSFLENWPLFRCLNVFRFLQKVWLHASIYRHPILKIIFKKIGPHFFLKSYCKLISKVRIEFRPSSAMC